MYELSTTAERLRIVKDAYHEFLTRWAVDQALGDSDVTDRIFGDIAAVEIETEDGDPFGRARRGLHSPGPNADN